MASGRGRGNMSLSMKLIRLWIVLLNLAFVIIGILLLAAGIYVLKDPKIQQLRPLLSPGVTTNYSSNLSNIEVLVIIIIAIGGILLAIGFLGCCGAIKGFRFLHLLYAVIIGLIILAEVVLVIIYVVYQNRFQSELVTKLQRSIAKYYIQTSMNNSGSLNPISRSWDLAQFNLQCCGALSKNDYANATYWRRADPYSPGANLTVPFTCCPLNSTRNWNGLPANMSEADQCARTGVNAYSQGCYDRLMDLILTYKTYFIIGGAIVGVVEILALVSSILLYTRKADLSTV